MKENNDDDLTELNKILLQFSKLQLSTKCALLTKLLSNLEEHMKTIGGNYDKLIQDIIKLSKGGK